MPIKLTWGQIFFYGWHACISSGIARTAKHFHLIHKNPQSFKTAQWRTTWSWQWLALNLTTSCMWCPKSWPFPTFPSDKQDGKVTPGNPVSYLPVSVYSGVFNFQALSICLYNPSGTNESIIPAINFEAVDLIEKLWFLYTQKAFQTILTDPAELKL